MKKNFFIPEGCYQVVLVLMVFACFASVPAMGNENIDPDSRKILQSMSSYMGGSKVLSVNADIGLEIINHDGQKLQLSSSAKVVMERPSKIYVARKGMLADVEFIFDGKLMTIYVKNIKGYTQTEVSGTIDDAILALEINTGLTAPGADLFFADPFNILSTGVESSSYIGTAYVNDTECHHLAFRESKFDWQLWVKAGDEPLPMKYVITSKWRTGAPQYEIRFRDWNANPKVDADLYHFSVPTGVKKHETLSVNELGEFITEKEGGDE